MMVERGQCAALLLLLLVVGLAVNADEKVATNIYSPVVQGFEPESPTHCSLDNQGSASIFYATCDDLQRNARNMTFADNCQNITVRLVRTRQHLVKYHFKNVQHTERTKVVFNIYDLALKKIGDATTVSDVCDPASAYMHNDALHFAVGSLNISSIDMIKSGLNDTVTSCPKQATKNSQLDVSNLVKYVAGGSERGLGKTKVDLVTAGLSLLNYHINFAGKRFSSIIKVSLDEGRDGEPVIEYLKCLAKVDSDSTAVLPIAILDLNKDTYETYNPHVVGNRTVVTTPKGCEALLWYDSGILFGVCIAIAVLLSAFIIMFVLYMCVWRIPRIKRRLAAMAGNYSYEEGEGGIRRRKHRHHCHHEETGEPCDCVCNSGCDESGSHTDDSNESKDGTDATGSAKNSKSKLKSKSKKSRTKTKFSNKTGAAGAAGGAFGEGEGGEGAGEGNNIDPNDPNAPQQGFGANPPAYQGGDGKPKPSGFFIGGGKNQSNFVVDQSKNPGGDPANAGGGGPGGADGNGGGEGTGGTGGAGGPAGAEGGGADGAGGAGGAGGGTFIDPKTGKKTTMDPKRTGMTKKTAAFGKNSNANESQAIGAGYDAHGSQFAYKGQKGGKGATKIDPKTGKKTVVEGKGGGDDESQRSVKKPNPLMRMFGFGGGKNTEAKTRNVGSEGGAGGGGAKASQVTKKYNVAGGNGPKASVAIGGKDHGRSQYV